MVILNRYSARPLLGHHALVWMVGFRMAGFILSGSGIRIFVLVNMGLGWGKWGKVQVEGGGVVGMDVEGDRGGVVCYLLEVLKELSLINHTFNFFLSPGHNH